MTKLDWLKGDWSRDDVYRTRDGRKAWFIGEGFGKCGFVLT